MSEDDFEKYKLTDEEYEQSLTMAELKMFMEGNAVKRGQPKSIFIVAQAGAGKTGLKNYIINEGQDNGSLESYVEINPDDVAIYHKYYKQILEEFPNDSYRILQEFVRPALDLYLRPKAVELKNNCIQEGTFGSTQGYIDIINFQKNGGEACIGEKQEDGTRAPKFVEGNYFIEIDVLAVDRFESYLSALEREQYFRENGLPPRVVTLENHDYAYKQMLETLRAIEQLKLFDRGRVYRRGYTINSPELVYISGDDKYSSMVEAVIREREKNRLELLSNPESYNKRIECLKSKAKDEDQIKRIEELQRIFNEEVKMRNKNIEGD